MIPGRSLLRTLFYGMSAHTARLLPHAQLRGAPDLRAVLGSL